MKPARLHLIALAGLIGLASSVSAQEWTRFRGPNGSGLGRAEAIPVQWTEADIDWKVSLPGIGHSSPVVWGDRVFVTSGDERTGTRIVQCFYTRDGRCLWSRRFPGEHHRKHSHNSFASATPTVDSRSVYVTWASPKEYLVVALDHDGEVRWRVDLGPFKSSHGFGASPIIHDGLLIVANEQNGPSFIVALDCDTGAIRWKVPRRSKASFSTPCVFQPPQQPAQIVVTNYEHGVTSIEPSSGRINWELDIFDRGHVETAIASPIVAGDLILATCGWMGVRQEVIAVEPPNQKDRPSPRKVYCIDRGAPLCTTPLAVGKLLFLWSDNGIVTCADVATGGVHWRRRVPGAYYASPVCIDDRLYNVSRDGDVVVLSASRRFEQLARFRLEEGSHSTPAVADGRMYIRTFTHLLAIRGERVR